MSTISLLRPSSRNALTLTRPTALVLDDAWADSLNSLSDASAVRQAVTDALDTASAAGADTVLFSGLSGQGALFDTKELTAAPAAAMPDGFFRKLDPVAELIKRLLGVRYPTFIDDVESVPIIDNVRPTGQVFAAKVVKGAALQVQAADAAPAKAA